MANYAVLKAAINAVIKTNGNKEITGQVLNQTLMAIVNSLGENYQFAGVAVPSTNPGTPDQNIFYLATQAGTYTNFGATVLPAGISMLEWRNGTWSSETFFTIDDAPTAGSGNLVKSGGVKTAIDNVAFSTNEKVKDIGIDSTPTSGSDNLIKSGAVFDAFKNDGGAYDVSVHFPTGGVEGGNTYTLDGAIAMVPQNIRKGGMSIKFVSSSDNKYVQYRLMSATFSTTPSDWQGVDDIPTAGSDNLVKSGGVSKADNFNAVSRASISFPSETSVTIETGYIYIRKGNSISKIINHESTTYTFSGSSMLCYNLASGNLEVKSTPSTDDIIMLWYDGAKGFSGGLLYKYYQNANITAEKNRAEGAERTLQQNLRKSDNINVVSRASISFPSETSVTIGTGYIYIRKGDYSIGNINRTTSETYDMSGSVMLCYNISTETLAVKSVPEVDDIIMLWHDTVEGFKDGLLYKYYQDNKVNTAVNNINTAVNNTKSYDNFNVISRAAITFPSDNSVTIGNGYIYIRKGNTVLKTINNTSTTYDMTGSVSLCFNLSTEVFAVKPLPEDNDIILLWHDGEEKFKGGLLYKYYQDNKVNDLVKEIVIKGALYEGDAEVIRNTSTYTTKDVYDSRIVGDTISQGIILYCKINGITSPDQISVDLYNGNTRLSINYFENREINLIIPVNCNRVVIVARAFGGEEGDIRSFSGISVRTNADNKKKTLYPDISIRDSIPEDLLYFPKEYVIPSYAKPSDAMQPIIHGATSSYPQNCATLYKLASKNRFNFWENDVRPCVGNYVLAHNDDMAGYALDENGDPITGNSWICSQKTLTELKTLKVGILPNTTTLVSGFENDKILSFEEYIILAKSYCAVPVIEIKFGATQSQVGELYAIVLKHGMQDSVIWNCYSNRFNHADYIKALNPKAYFLFTFYPPQESISMKTNIDTCKTYETFSGQVMVSLPWGSWSDEVDGVILKDYANSLGLRLATWPTLNSTYKAQIEAGVCGFCSNMGAGLEDNPYYYLQKNYI